VSISPGSSLFTLEVESEFPEPNPGQFVHVAASEELTLRRPFSIAGRPTPEKIDLLIEIRGKGTRALTDLPYRAPVSIMGPLGNGFSEPEGDGRAVVVAGGIGVAGIRFLAHELHASGRSVLALVGARTRNELLDHLLPPTTSDGRFEVAIATDDGTAGFWGTVCELLDRELDEIGRPSKVYCCGPVGMLAETAAVARDMDLPCELAFEEIMACGTGACRGCVIATKQGYRTVCKDGPVFDAREIVFEGAPCV